METITFGKFAHMKGDELLEALDGKGRLDLTITPRGSKQRKLAVTTMERLDALEAAQKELEKRIAIEKFQEENRKAFEEHNRRVAERGIVGRKHWRY